MFIICNFVMDLQKRSDLTICCFFATTTTYFIGEAFCSKNYREFTITACYVTIYSNIPRYCIDINMHKILIHCLCRYVYVQNDDGAGLYSDIVQSKWRVVVVLL